MGQGAVASGDQGQLSRRLFGRRAAAVVGGGVLGSVLLPQAAEAATSPNWLLVGNTGTTSTKFLGTTDGKPLNLRTANVQRMVITATGNVGIGTIAPAAKLEVTGAAGHDGASLHTSGNGYGLVASNDSTGSPAGGLIRGDTVGLLAVANKASGTAVRALNTNTHGLTGVAVQGFSAAGTADRLHPGGQYFSGAGEFCGPYGVIGAASTDSTAGVGVLGIADNPHGAAVLADGRNGATALQVQGPAQIVGNCQISGTLSKGGGSFRIDHPLDPAGKYLSHSFVESPDMMNVYNGTVVLDARGEAVVALPDWFEALNRDFRYQLTAIGAPGPNVHVVREVEDGSFTIGGGTPGLKVSWQLTGVRQDAWANKHRIPVEESKPPGEQGRYLHPEIFGPVSADEDVDEVATRRAKSIIAGRVPATTP